EVVSLSQLPTPVCAILKSSGLPTIRLAGVRNAGGLKIRAGGAAGHQSTAQAGADILSRGGSAVDAAVSMMLVSCAAETIFTGLGGGGFATVYDAATTQVRCLDFFVAVPGVGGKQPSPATSIEVIFIGQQGRYEIGPATVAGAGIPAGAHYLWQRWGRLPWSTV